MGRLLHFSQGNAWPIQPQVALTNERLGERRDFLPKLTCQAAYHQACEYMQQQGRKQVRILSQREGSSGACRPMWTNVAKAEIRLCHDSRCKPSYTNTVKVCLMLICKSHPNMPPFFIQRESLRKSWAILGCFCCGPVSRILLNRFRSC